MLNIPFQIQSSITLEDLSETVAEKLNQHARRVQLQYRLESDKAKAAFMSIQLDEELEMFKDHMRLLIMPQLLPSSKISTRPLKPVLVVFEDSGNDDSVEPPAHVSAGNSHKAVCVCTSHFMSLIYFRVRRVPPYSQKMDLHQNRLGRHQTISWTGQMNSRIALKCSTSNTGATIIQRDLRVQCTAIVPRTQTTVMP